ncbi:MAG: pyridoxal phosphate-dependent aminotransferase [Thermoleophilia bacterium]
MARVAPSLDLVPGSRIRELADIAMALDGEVLKLYFGESNLPTPRLVKDAAIDALEAGYTYYTENAGLPSLRRELAYAYRRLHGVELDPASELVVTASGVQALNLAIRCTLDPGDEAIVLAPVWPNGAAIVRMANATPVMVAQPLVGDQYRIDLDAVEAAITDRTRMILVTSPSNPLGWVASVEEQQRLLDLCRERDLWLLADEVYERLWWAGPEVGAAAPSVLRLASRDDPVVVVQSFSKTYCMTGWRVGWLVGRRDLVAKATQLNEFVVSHAATFTQKAAEAGLVEGEAGVLELLAMLRENRDLCLDALGSMPGVTVPRPDGAFYLFPRVEGLTDSFAFCRDLLLETRVGLAPGVAFGDAGEGSLRLCYAAERRILEAALERLADFLARRR